MPITVLLVLLSALRQSRYVNFLKKRNLTNQELKNIGVPVCQPKDMVAYGDYFDWRVHPNRDTSRFG